MKQKSKYLFGASMSLLISFTATITPAVDNDGITIAMNVVYCVAIVIAILCTRGYADVSRRESRGQLHGKYLTLTAKLFGLDRRYFGWEFDSSLNKRIKRERGSVDYGLSMRCHLHEQRVKLAKMTQASVARPVGGGDEEKE